MYHRKPESAQQFPGKVGKQIISNWRATFWSYAETENQSIIYCSVSLVIYSGTHFTS